MLEVSDSGQFRDLLFKRGMSSSSLKRIFSSLRAVVNLATREQGIAISNVFSDKYIHEDELKQKRPPIPVHVLMQIQAECQDLNDAPRWRITLISNTGMHLSEACGLLVSEYYPSGHDHTLH